ncbi:tRNA (cmo5U34)-methyltransferase [Methylomagnum ishizawai]|uniref:Carboxy-S-adenosyl-L-methionine synthase n=1 Tax=Methylomagnum ishizawai TaxID=1760988 RepID=A0A1Y6CTZ3_9GAMM|nr:carboxy-S-adenosyl-L-methionine synthase CmoA [Methylomagnum ishizawai]SMF93660.1 tRNA (cmo5U34)-methyltransferase [Methylomagnum ishizawai]
MSKDQLFRAPQPIAGDFNFGQETALVFDDMLDRSVPFYAELQRMIGEIAADFAAEGSRLYDLGCSTGTTLLCLDRVVPPGVAFVGVDASPEMLEQARQKLARHGLARSCELVRQNLDQGVALVDASVVVMNLTLQFVRPLHRDRLIAAIAQGTRANGCLILVEKVLGQDSTVNRLFIKYHYDFKKRNGYSELEIAQKREALENVLIPYHFEENRELLLRNGFRTCDVFFRWYNFCGMLAIK